MKLLGNSLPPRFASGAVVKGPGVAQRPGECEESPLGLSSMGRSSPSASAQGQSQV